MLPTTPITKNTLMIAADAADPPTSKGKMNVLQY